MNKDYVNCTECNHQMHIDDYIKCECCGKILCEDCLHTIGFDFLCKSCYDEAHEIEIEVEE